MKLLKNHTLINYLTDHRKIQMVSVTRDVILCELTDKFTPHDVEEVYRTTLQWPVTRRQNGKNYIIFRRHPVAPSTPPLKLNVN